MVGRSIKLVVAMVALASVRTAFADTDQSVLFGSPLPEQTGLYGVLQPMGSYVVYALRGDQAWPPAEEGERWPAYIARVNQVQSMPSGLWLSSVILDDMRANEIADQVNVLAGEVSFRHQVSWGYFDNGTTSVLAILFVDETARVVPDGFVVDNDEDLVVRSFHAVAYPVSETGAAEQFGDFFLPQIDDEGSGGDGLCTGTKPGGDRTPRMVEGFCRNDYLHRKHPTRNGDSNKRIDGDRATVMSGGENAAGLACGVARNNCGTTCETTYVASYVSCESTFQTCFGLIGIGCAGLAIAPPAAFVCIGAAMAACGTSNYNCHEVNISIQTSCMVNCQTSYSACCHQDGTRCRAG